MPFASVRRRPRPAFQAPVLPAARPATRLARRAPRALLTTTRVTLRLDAPLGLSLTQTRRAGAARVVVSSVRADGSAAPHVRVGDVITHVADAPAESLDAVVARLARAPQPVTLVLERAAPPPAPEAPRDTHDIYAHQDAAIANLISVYQQTRREARAEDALRNLLSVAAGIVKARASTSSGSPALISSVLYRLKRAGIPLDVRFYNIVMWSYIAADEPARAIALFEEIAAPNVECYTTVVKAHSMLRRPDDAIALIPVMRGRGIKPNIRTYNALIASCVRGGKLEKARQLFSEMLVDDVKPNAVSWNIIINWYVQEKKGPKRLDGALDAFADMKASGVSPNVITFTTVMKAYAKSGLLNKAEEVFNELKSRLPGRVDTSVYNTLLSAYSARLDWRRCLELLREMKTYNSGPVWCGGAGEAGAADTAGTGRGVPASRSFERGRPWLGARDDGGEATPASKRASLLQEEDNACAPDAVSYSLAVKSCARAGRAEVAREVFDEMMERGFFPPPGPAVVSLMTGYARAGMLPESFAVLKQLKSWGVFADARMLSALMHGCVVAKQPRLALSVYAKLKGARLEADVVTHTLLLRAYGMLGELDKMVNVAKGMQGRAGGRPNVVTYNALIECSVAHGRTDLALKSLDMLLRDGRACARVNRQTFDALTGAGAGGGGAALGDALGDEAALQFLMDVLRRVREARAAPNGTLYAALLACCERAGEWHLGASLVRERDAGGFVVARRDQRDVRVLEDAFRARAATRRAE